MTLAQVVYNMSTDRDFASQLYNNPDYALASRGFTLSKEEVNFLLAAHRRGQQEDWMQILALSRGTNAAWL